MLKQHSDRNTSVCNAKSRQICKRQIDYNLHGHVIMKTFLQGTPGPMGPPGDPGKEGTSVCTLNSICSP